MPDNNNRRHPECAQPHATANPRQTHAATDSASEQMLVGLQSEWPVKYTLKCGITTIGREPRNDLQLRSSFVSRFHARLVCDAKGTLIEDLDSRNGIYVNSTRVQRHRLCSGDYLTLGRVHLQYINLHENAVGSGNA